MPAALLLAAAAALVDDPWEPDVLYLPNDKCKRAFHSQMLAKEAQYASCGAYGGGHAPTFQIANATVAQCVSYCYQRERETLPIGTSWLISERREDGACRCYGGDAAGRPPSPEDAAAPGNCSTVTHYVPLGCLWAGARACKDAPGPPNGCVWTLQGCCVDAAGYTEWEEWGWPPPRWFLGCGAVVCMLLLCSGFVTATGRVARQHDADAAAPPLGGPSPAAAARCLALPDTLAFVADADHEDDCCICLDGMEAGAKLVAMPKCGHVLHYACFNTYVAHVASKVPPVARCPVCRAALLDGDGDRDGDAATAAAEEPPPLREPPPLTVVIAVPSAPRSPVIAALD